MTSPIPHWPGRLVSLSTGEQVYVAETPRRENDPSEARPPVLCVHGMSGSATNWTDFMAELAPDFHCTAVDLPGSGFSPPPRTKAGYSIKALASTVIRLIETLGHGPVHLVGNSMGGAVSIRLAATRPDLLRSLTLVSPVLPDPRVRPELLRFPLVALPGLGEWLMRRTELIPAENRVAGVVATCYCDPGAVHPDRFWLEVAELRRRDNLGYNAATLSRAARAIVAENLRPGRYSLWRAAARVTVPALVIFGSRDKLVNPRLAKPARRAFRGATVEVLPRTGHVAQMEHPGLLAGRFREMVDSVSPGGATPLDPPAHGGLPAPHAPRPPAGNAGRRDPVDA
jgi:pimeloyl-ACP methyl ester carboxylesterase